MPQAGFTAVIPYYSIVAGHEPDAAHLGVGEIAINIPDGKMFVNDGGTIKVFPSVFNFGTFLEQTSVDLPPTGAVTIYSKVVSGVSCWFMQNDAGDIIQFTAGNSLNVTLPDSTLAPLAVQAATYLSALLLKTKSVDVVVSGGDYSLDLDSATVFNVAVTESGTVTFVAADPTFCYQFTVNATTTGAYLFTALTMSGVTIYKKSGSTITLQASGRTVLGCTYDGAKATLDVFEVQMEVN